MPVLGAMAENATLFVVYNQSQAALKRLFPPPPLADSRNDAPHLSIPQTATAAALAGAAASFVLTPVELVKCKMQVSNIAAAAAEAGTLATSPATAAAAAAAAPSPQPGAIAFTRSILREYGLRGLWLGQTGTLIRETGGGAAWFTTFELLVAYFIQRRAARGETSSSAPGVGGRVTKADLSAVELMAAGAAAGVTYNVVLFPADCIKSTIQTEDELRGLRGSGGKKEPRRSFFQVGKDIYTARGLRGLYSGCGLTALKAAPSSALIFYMCVLFVTVFQIGLKARIMLGRTDATRDVPTHAQLQSPRSDVRLDLDSSLDFSCTIQDQNFSHTPFRFAHTDLLCPDSLPSVTDR